MWHGMAVNKVFRRFLSNLKKYLTAEKRAKRGSLCQARQEFSQPK